MKTIMIAILVTLAATVSFAQDQDKTTFCTYQALRIQKTASEINELVKHGKINRGEHSVLLEMLNNTSKGVSTVCLQK
ncbi:hypothetical protein D3C87_240780 [compost metagenome]